MIYTALQNIIIGLCMFAIPNKNSVILFLEKTKPITETNVLEFRVLKNGKIVQKLIQCMFYGEFFFAPLKKKLRSTLFEFF